MRKYALVFITSCILLALIGCSNNPNQSNTSTTDSSDQPGIEGYVIEKANGSILVVDPIPQDFSSTGGVSEFHNAISFSNAPAEVNIGDKVQVWFDSVAESYPGQSKVKKIKVINSVKPANAELTEAEAIQRALAQTKEKTEITGLTVILSATFNAASDTWNIHLKKGEVEFSIEVNDEKTF